VENPERGNTHAGFGERPEERTRSNADSAPRADSTAPNFSSDTQPAVLVEVSHPEVEHLSTACSDCYWPGVADDLAQPAIFTDQTPQ